MVGSERYSDDPSHREHGGLKLVLSGIMLVAALVIMLVAGMILFRPEGHDATPFPSLTQAAMRPLGIAEVAYPTPFPTLTPLPTLPPVDWIHPTAAAQEIAAALDTPMVNALDAGAVQRQLDPLTIIPARARSTVITYDVKKGDNLRTIAERFGLAQNTIIWSNDRFYVNAMRVGMQLTILPVDGVYHHVPEPETIADVAQTYKVDPYAIIDSEYNSLFGTTPQTVLPQGLYVVVPGGTGSTEPIYWDPGIVMTKQYTTDGSNPIGSGVKAGTDYALFAQGDPGSCGKQAVQGGSPPVSPPLLSRYTITQDFSWNHGGIDLATPPGTRVYAAGGGTVIFVGWSTWGYGYTVVIAHGGTLSIYGHLNGAFVGCGEVVTVGQNIAVTGNSGRSSGPHLHFEIRGPGGSPVNPWNYQSF
jgi:murein DD-endopeptidase MepM/ murein hydrolase activator NlpD